MTANIEPNKADATSLDRHLAVVSKWLIERRLTLHVPHKGKPYLSRITDDGTVQFVRYW